MPGFPKDKTTHGLRASEACPPELLNGAFELILDCVETVYPSAFYNPRTICKQYILSLIGLWGRRYQYSWRVATSQSEDDRLGPLFKSVSLPDGRLDLYTRTETLTNVTMLPISLIALNMEHVYLKLA